MTICANVSDLFHELRSAAGTVLSIVGSRLEATERARVDEVGPQWLTEFEAERDVPFEPLSKCADMSCGCQDDARYQSSAADTAADPSPTVLHATDYPVGRVVGGEGSGGASDILQSAPPERPDKYWPRPKFEMYPDMYGRAESDPGAVTSPAPGEQVLEDDLAAHIMGDFVSGQEVDALTATLIDALSSRIASALLGDFTITRKK